MRGKRFVVTASAFAPALSAWGQCDFSTFDDSTYRVAISGDVAIGSGVSAPGTGAVFVYRFDGAAWSFEQQLSPSDAAITGFGFQLAVDGNVIGVMDYDTPKVFLFRYDGEQWAEEQVLTAPMGPGPPHNGIALHGDLAAIAYDGDPSVHVYRFDGTTWDHEQQVAPPAPLLTVGEAVVAEEGIIAVRGGDSQHNAVDIFRYSGTEWQFEQRLLHPAMPDSLTGFGSDLAVHGDTLAVASPGHTAGPSVFVYRYRGGQWVLQQQLPEPQPNSSYASTVALLDGLLVTGANHADTVWGELGGAVYVYERQGDVWGDPVTLVPSVQSYQFGQRVEAADGRMIVSGPKLMDVPVPADCDGNAYHDECELVLGLGTDCDGNGVIDACDIAAAPAADCDGDGLLDTCGRLTAFSAVSPAFSPAGSAYAYDWSPTLPPAESMVELTISASGDFDDYNESIIVLLNGELIAQVTLYLQPQCVAGSKLLLLSKSQFNSARESGPFTITLDPFNASAADCGGNSFVSAELNYAVIEPLIDCNGNLAPDSCDIADGTSVDTNGDGVPDECECPADLDGDGSVGILDFLALLGFWGTPAGDLDGDGDTGILDFLAVLGAWGECP